MGLKDLAYPGMANYPYTDVAPMDRYLAEGREQLAGLAPREIEGRFGGPSFRSNEVNPFSAMISDTLRKTGPVGNLMTEWTQDALDTHARGDYLPWQKVALSAAEMPYSMASKPALGLAGMIVGRESGYVTKAMEKVIKNEYKKGKLSPKEINLKYGGFMDDAGNVKAQLSDADSKLKPTLLNSYNSYLAKSAQKDMIGTYEQPIGLFAAMDHPLIFDAFKKHGLTTKTKVQFKDLLRIDEATGKESRGVGNVSVRLNREGKLGSAVINVDPVAIRDMIVKLGGDVSETDLLHDVMIHELQHIIQYIENHPGGASVAYFDKIKEPAYKAEQIARRKSIINEILTTPAYNKDKIASLSKEVKDIENHLKFIDRVRETDSGWLYDITLGEQDAFWSAYTRKDPDVELRLPYQYDPDKQRSVTWMSAREKDPKRSAIIEPGSVYATNPNIELPTNINPLKIQPDEVRKIISSKKNYVTPLKTYSDTLYRETNADGALDLLPFSNRTSQINDLYVANTKDFALGQGKNKGFLIEMDSGNMEGFLQMGKPGADMALDSGMVEMTIRSPSQKELRNLVKSFTIKNDAKTTPVEKAMIRRVIKSAEANGWIKETTEEGVRYIRPTGPINIKSGSLPKKGLRAAVQHDATGELYIAPENSMHYKAYEMYKKDHYGEPFRDDIFVDPQGNILNRKEALQYAEQEVGKGKFRSDKRGLDATDYKDVKQASNSEPVDFSKFKDKKEMDLYYKELKEAINTKGKQISERTKEFFINNPEEPLYPVNSRYITPSGNKVTIIGSPSIIMKAKQPSYRVKIEMKDGSDYESSMLQENFKQFRKFTGPTR